jgi:8-amino-7-oxononanoate synthase/dethiobiotin synthase
MGTSWAGAELERLERLDLRRHPPVLDSPPGPEVTVAGRSVLLLCSNDYLGLAGDARLASAAGEAAQQWGAGAGASRLVSGTTMLHTALEQELAALKGCGDAVLFSSGYLANAGTIPALVGPGDLLLSDELNHASIVDGCRLSGARRAVYRHADPRDLDRLLAEASERRRLVVTDTVFSMDGDVAPLADLVEVCERHGAMLMVDEAHATGVLGPQGGGAVEMLGLQGRVTVVMGTLSKALGSSGGFVAASADLVELLRNRARTHVYDTALGPPSVGAARRALGIVREEPERRHRVRALARRLFEGLAELGYDVREPVAAIVPLIVGEAGPAVRLSMGLLDRGVLAPAIRPPSVPPGTARLRLTAMATHTDDHVEQVLEAFAALRSAGREGPWQHAVPADRLLGTKGAEESTALGGGGRKPLGSRAGAEARLDPRIVASGGVFVTGTDTGVGKTVVAAAIVRNLRGLGIGAAVLKPVQTGTDEGADDAAFVAAAGGVEPRLAEVPYRLRAPLAPSVAARLEGVDIDLERIHRAFRRLRSEAGMVVVEGAGGLLVPVTEDVTMAGLAAGLRLPVVVVVRPGLGTVNHTCLTVAAARALGLEVCGLVISGFPSTATLAEATNPAVLEQTTGVPLWGCIPMVEGLDVDAGRPGSGFDPAPWLAPTLGGRFDRVAFLARLRVPEEAAHGARA